MFPFQSVQDETQCTALTLTGHVRFSLCYLVVGGQLDEVMAVV